MKTGDLQLPVVVQGPMYVAGPTGTERSLVAALEHATIRQAIHQKALPLSTRIDASGIIVSLRAGRENHCFAGGNLLFTVRMKSPPKMIQANVEQINRSI